MFRTLFILICTLVVARYSMADPYYNSYSARPRTQYQRPCPPGQHCSSNRYYKNKEHSEYRYNKKIYRPRSSYNNNFLPQNLYVGAAIGHTMPIGFEMNPGSLKHSRGSPVYTMLSGTDLYDWLRVGTEASYNQCTLKETLVEEKSTVKGTFSHSTIMLNSYLTMPRTRVKPYLLLGIGLSRNTISGYKLINKSVSFPNNTTNNFAYQVGGGISFPYRNFAFDGEIKYANKGTAKTKAGINGASGEPARQAKITDFTFLMSVRYYFYSGSLWPQ
jgi:opacity protein-like surface antigen